MCNKHKLEDMECTSRKKCIFENCDKLAYYGVKKIEYCSLHKLENHVNLESKYC